ncbi:chemotaxis response regulator protein-glutamate methylesterase [Paenibacillus sp. UMB4589-SE434]|uniref:protein-glutamate methylesterase/protein-glutamine glutaminase n=1 Tax=Paenibacillus sp. UMB4589-SE434 TaxID=3046314 RepID=UPI00254FE02F|nr:chemotaxis response regulator protein-glutamate methylesterase [Paenibacillus sp. UMB4589-SE434]MDK8180711.1 chemotaxis response regulator protein-glutamate methylesterase [Paenibacillus sp. UMB4589-SE434]
MTTKKILVVDDSPFMRTIISDLIALDTGFNIVGTARNGVEAVEKVKLLTPDAVTMDVEMPIRNGLQALQGIMAECPTPVIMLSSLTEEGRQETLSALELGAFDFVCKPSPTSGSQDIHKVGEMLHEKLHAAILSHERRQLLKRMREELSKSYARETEARQHKVSKSKALEAKQSTGNHETRVSKDTVNKVPKYSANDSTTNLKQQQTLPKSVMPVPSKSVPSSTASRQQESVTRTQSSEEKKQAPRNMGAADSLEKQSVQKTEQQTSGKDLKQAVALDTGVKKVSSSSTARSSHFKHIVAVGTSTGGPRALKELLSQLPGTLKAPVLIVQHMPPNFTKSLSQRLHSYSELEVREAQHGDVLQAGVAYLAPGGQHMTVVLQADGSYAVSLNRQEPRSGHRPSVDMMFESLLPFKQLQRHIVLLTGMGSDGARSMRKLYEEGVRSTFAESEDSCVVFGMPRAAIELGCVSRIVPIQDMAQEIVRAIN